jgi:hypothetical protein
MAELTPSQPDSNESIDLVVSDEFGENNPKLRLQISTVLEVSATSLVGHSFALYNARASKFLQMHPDGSMGVLEEASITPTNIESTRTWETFKIVHGGRGKIALYNESHRRFVRLVKRNVNGLGGQLDENQLPQESDWPSERFSIVDAGGGLVAFHSSSEQRFIRLYGRSTVDACSGVCSAESLPLDWDSERFQLVPMPRPAHPRNCNRPSLF